MNNRMCSYKLVYAIVQIIMTFHFYTVCVLMNRSLIPGIVPDVVPDVVQGCLL